VEILIKIIMNNIENTLTLINSLDKIYNKARINGKLDSINLYLLNIISNILNHCNIELSNKTKTKLENLYITIYNHSKEICKTNIIKPYNNTIFVQADINDYNDFPKSNKIYYWQDDRLSSNITAILQSEVLANNYFLDKLYKTKNQFSTGVDIEYLETHKKCFMIFESEITNYIIKNITTNTIITDDFDIVLIPTLKATLLVTNKDFSEETIKIQIT